MSSKHLVTAAATLLVLLSGCSEANNKTGTTEEDTEETTSGKPSPRSVLADFQPCALVDSATLAALQLTGGEEDKILGARICRWHREGTTVKDLYTVSLGLLDERALSDLNAPQKQPTTIGSHEAVTFVDAAGNCGVGIAVTETSRVETSATGGDQEVACRLSNQLAKAIEPKLP